jgi:hypothetical protein
MVDACIVSQSLRAFDPAHLQKHLLCPLIQPSSPLLPPPVSPVNLSACEHKNQDQGYIFFQTVIFFQRNYNSITVNIL